MEQQCEKKPRASSRFATALSFAAELHAGQVRKGTHIPYIVHPIAVASLALEHGADEDEAIAALLHDAVEDQGGLATAATIETLYGKRVVDIVLGCSNSYGGQSKGLSAEKKAAHLEHLKTAGASVLLVTAADKLHNARAILSDLRLTLTVKQQEAFWRRFNVGPPETLSYYKNMAIRLQQGCARLQDANEGSRAVLADAEGIPALVAELDLVVREIEVLMAVQGGVVVRQDTTHASQDS